MTSTPAPASPWWASASVEELTLSEGVVTEFIREGEVPALEETMRFARALALQTLCVRTTALEEAIASAEALTDPYRAWVSRSGARADRPDPTGWVRRSPSIRQGFEFCLSMLPAALADVASPRVREFSELSKALEDANRDSYFREGTRRPLAVEKAQFHPKRRSDEN